LCRLLAFSTAHIPLNEGNGAMEGSPFNLLDAQNVPNPGLECQILAGFQFKEDFPPLAAVIPENGDWFTSGNEGPIVKERMPADGSGCNVVNWSLVHGD
jgi:hypothetical protein